MKTNLLSTHSFAIPVYMDSTAWAEHVPFAFELTKRLKPTLLVELGTHYGVSYFAFCQAVETNSLSCACYAVDTWRGDEHAGFYEEDIFNQVHAHNDEHYAGFSYLLRSTFREALPYFADKSIDLLHIDGLHSYEAVKQDFEAWLPKLSDSSVVLFHDIAVRERGFGVFQLWDELSLLYPSFSFIHGHGLGVLATGKNISPELAAFFRYKENADEIQEVRYCYQRLGSSLSDSLYASQSTNYLYTKLDEMTKGKDAMALELETLQQEKTRQAQQIADYRIQRNRLTEENQLHVQAIRHELDECKIAQENCALEVSRLTEELRSYRESLSWKITKPLRLVRTGLLRLLGPMAKA